MSRLLLLWVHSFFIAYYKIWWSLGFLTFVTAKQIPRDVLLIDISYPMCRVLCARREQKKRFSMQLGTWFLL